MVPGAPARGESIEVFTGPTRNGRGRPAVNTRGSAVRGSDGSAVERPMPNPGGQPAAPDPMDTAEAPSRAGSRARRGTVTAREPGRPAGSAPSASSRGRERGGTHRGIRSPPGSIPQPGTAQPRHGRTGLAGAPAPIRPAG